MFLHVKERRKQIDERTSDALIVPSLIDISMLSERVRKKYLRSKRSVKFKPLIILLQEVS